MKNKAIIINDTSNEKHVGSFTVIKMLKFLCKKYGIEVIKTVTRREITDDIIKVKNTLYKGNIVIVNGEGSLHDSPLWFYKLLEILPEKHKNFLINSLWEKMYFGNSDRLNKFDLISVRESKSYKELTKIKKDNVIITPDLIFYLSYSGINKIGYTDSVLPSLKESLKKQQNYIPLSYVSDFPNIETHIQWLKTLDLHITGRFHGVCLSAIANTPFLAFPSNSHKIESILNDMDCSELLITSFEDITKDKKEKAKELIHKAHLYSKEAKGKIELLFETIIKKINENEEQ